VALLLRAKGITRVRPLEGGIDAWLASHFPFVTESLVKKSLSSERRSPYCPVTGIVDPMNSATLRLSQMSKVKDLALLEESNVFDRDPKFGCAG
jgi:3-mercaptopyruvate sulfurtransferase SseA